MTVDPFDPLDSEFTSADKPSVFIKAVTPEVLTNDDSDGPITVPTVRPDDWVRSESEIQSRPYVEYRESESSELNVMADQDGIYFSLGGEESIATIAMNDKDRVERFIRAIERAWDDHEFLSVMKGKNGAHSP